MIMETPAAPAKAQVIHRNQKLRVCKLSRTVRDLSGDLSCLPELLGFFPEYRFVIAEFEAGFSDESGARAK
jgi:hypothetical protein